MGHGLHSVAPSSSWNSPAGQGVHLGDVDASVNVPFAHLVCAVLPVVAKEPGLVGVHWAALLRLVALENEPSLHGSAALAASGQNEPSSHGLHESLPGSS